MVVVWFENFVTSVTVPRRLASWCQTVILSDGIFKLHRTTILDTFYASVATACQEHRAFGLSIHAYVCPSVDHVKIFVQGRISRPINGSKLIFHMRMYTRPAGICKSHDLYFTVHWLQTGQIIKVKKLRTRLGSLKTGLSPPVFQYWQFQGGTSVVVPYCVTCSCCPFLYFGSPTMWVTCFS